MSKILGVWGEIPDEHLEWHEDKHVPAATKRLGTRAFHFEAGENAFAEEHKQTATSFTLYEGLESTEPQSFAEQTLPQADSLSDVPKEALLNARYYTCTMMEQAKDFTGDYTDAGCLVMGNFQPSRATHDDFFKWWHDEFVSIIKRSPDFLRVRLWKLDSAADFKDGSASTPNRDDLLVYIMAYEFSSDDIPWDITIQIAQSEGWQRFVEHDLRIYTKDGAVEAEFNNEDYFDEEEED
ncbi:hypothetical protein N0V90_005235 [Kalmusia sp. IMI 367209]|nr:hypothetical protein N0V90_005235 [Kalmusia sp. IMI 367209]